MKSDTLFVSRVYWVADRSVEQKKITCMDVL